MKTSNNGEFVLLFLFLKLVSAIFYSISIFSPNVSPRKSIKNVFLFHRKSSFCSPEIHVFAFFPFLSTLSRFKRRNVSGIIYIASSNLVRSQITNKEIFLNLFCDQKSDWSLVPGTFCFR